VGEALLLFNFNKRSRGKFHKFIGTNPKPIYIFCRGVPVGRRRRLGGCLNALLSEILTNLETSSIYIVK